MPCGGLFPTLGSGTAKALSMPLTIWKFVWSLSDNCWDPGYYRPSVFAAMYVSFATVFYIR